MMRRPGWQGTDGMYHTKPVPVEEWLEVIATELWAARLNQQLFQPVPHTPDVARLLTEIAEWVGGVWAKIGGDPSEWLADDPNPGPPPAPPPETDTGARFIS